ncbi:MAG: aldo/keto reductase [Actinomycetia bacterium]|nr:aldo/keto reductase [Actinomycetes bacterium]
MDRVWLPALGRDVSRIALGTWSMGGWQWGGADEDAARATIARALDRGIDIIDTAPVYGFGLSEELVGDVLERRGNRADVVIATKLGLSWDSRHEPWRDSSPGRIREEVVASLARLRTDYIDLYQVHWPDETVDLDRTAAALSMLVEEGLVRAVGVCNYTASQMAAFSQGGRLDAAQFRYNLFERSADSDVVPFCRARGLMTLAYSPLARGLLSGAMQPGHESSDHARRGSMFHGAEYARHLSAVERLDAFARETYGRRVIHLAIRWVLDQPGMTIALWGARRPEQLDATAGVEGFALDDAARAEIDRIIVEEIGTAALSNQ